MIDASALRSGKGHRDENFPVASFLLPRPMRPHVAAVYAFARAADDFRKALACECSEPERRFLERRLAALNAEIAEQAE